MSENEKASIDRSELLSMRQAAKRIGISDRMIREAISDGKLPGYRVGKRTIHVRWKEVEEWISAAAVRGSS